jgi:CubicO group peptidase (beta-lactamase class C family)
MNDPPAQTVADVLRPLGLTEEMVRAHVLRPDHIVLARTGIERHELPFRDLKPARTSPFYRLNTEKLGQALHALLSPCLVGYSLRLRRYGRVVLAEQWNWARTPVDGGVFWTPDVPLHLASVSKVITAMAMTKLLHDRGISLNAGIASWLPDYWVKGPNVDRITFRHLLTHRSGLVFTADPTPSDFLFMKDQIAHGTRHLGELNYQNMNFGLCRILIATIDRPYLFGVFGLTPSEAYWDLTSISAYARYVDENIFAPAGVTGTLDHPAADALAYRFPDSGPGWDSSDLRTMSGGVGWHLSVNDLLTVMAHFRRRGTIVDPGVAEMALDSLFGIDVVRDTPLGRIYAKGGFWSDGDGRIEQCNAFFLPGGMELVILANSTFCTPGTNFMGMVTAAIEASIESTLFTTVVTLGAALAAVRLVRRFRPRRRR